MAVDDVEKAWDEPTDDLLINRVEGNKLLPLCEVEDLDQPLIVVLTRQNLVESDKHHCFLVESVRLDYTIWILLLFEEIFRLEVAEHYLDFLKAEKSFEVLPENELILWQELEFLWDCLTH